MVNLDGALRSSHSMVGHSKDIQRQNSRCWARSSDPSSKEVAFLIASAIFSNDLTINLSFQNIDSRIFLVQFQQDYRVVA